MVQYLSMGRASRKIELAVGGKLTTTGRGRREVASSAREGDADVTLMCCVQSSESWPPTISDFIASLVRSSRLYTLLSPSLPLTRPVLRRHRTHINKQVIPTPRRWQLVTSRQVVDLRDRGGPRPLSASSSASAGGALPSCLRLRSKVDSPAFYCLPLPPSFITHSTYTPSHFLLPNPSWESPVSRTAEPRSHWDPR